MVLDAHASEAAVLYIAEICISKRADYGASLLRDARMFIAHLLDTHSNN